MSSTVTTVIVSISKAVLLRFIGTVVAEVIVVIVVVVVVALFFPFLLVLRLWLLFFLLIRMGSAYCPKEERLRRFF